MEGSSESSGDEERSIPAGTLAAKLAAESWVAEPSDTVEWCRGSKITNFGAVDGADGWNWGWRSGAVVV